MDTFHATWISFVLLAFVSFISIPCAVLCRGTPPNDNSNQLQTYIIQVQKPIATMDEESLKVWYKSFLPESSDNSERLLHSYSEVFSGFSAKLKEEELKSVAKKEGFLREYPDRVLPLVTTHTPDFLGLQVGQGLWSASSLGEGLIIGVLDTGVTPNHPSFDDDGMPQPPTKWTGSCDFNTGCNNKLIGAKNLVSGRGGTSPTDVLGHGTHTASTAAGNFVRNASAYGLAGGTAAGVAPHAHLAIYQVCTDRGCGVADILAGLDAAVKDGVDVLSLSIGGASVPFDRDALAIGAFGAVEKGIFVSCAAGNNGPGEGTLSNEAPWILTVAASTIDRSQRATVKLGDGQEIHGETLDQSPTFTRSSVPLFFSKDSPTCESLAEGDVKGKVVVCDVRGPLDVVSLVQAAGGVGLILVNDVAEGSSLLDFKFGFSTVFLSHDDGNIIKSYAASAPEPTASIILDGTVLGVSPAPVIAHFTSRGPSRASPGIVKPDISGPGVNILAAWFTSVDGTQGTNTFNIISGTSMATPHLSGVAALVKRVHPDWSPAAIKSAIVTTSDDRGRDGKPIQNELHNPASFFAMGAGHVNPSKAADPGLVYDLVVDDYIAYICGLYGSSGASAIARGKPVDCAQIKNITEAELNYPSILLVPAENGAAATVSRTVTNVGPAGSSYTVEVNVPETVSVTVEPPTLGFSQVNEKKSFTVSAKWMGSPPSASALVEGNLRWVSDKHVVRSPVVISTSN